MASGRNQVLPFTLTELFVLLFFALAIALARETEDRQRMESEAEGFADYVEVVAAARELGPAAAAEVVRMIAEAGRGIPEDFDELVRSLEEQGQGRELITSALAETGADSAWIEAASTSEMLDSLLEVERVSRWRYQTLADASGTDDARSTLGRLTDSIVSLTEQRRELSSQVAYFRNRVGNGLDHPPCWANQQGEIEYAYEAILRTESVDLRAIWPQHREEDARDTPGMTAAVGDDMSYQEFSARVSPVLAWSTGQEPECRHFVVILDSVAGGKEPFKRGLLTVERFFYKRLEN